MIGKIPLRKQDQFSGCSESKSLVLNRSFFFEIDVTYQYRSRSGCSNPGITSKGNLL